MASGAQDVEQVAGECLAILRRNQEPVVLHKDAVPGWFPGGSNVCRADGDRAKALVNATSDQHDPAWRARSFANHK